ncbi:hypothetical protein DB346_02520 [Verrucomicrobia bacterium LW23]|nr:hypothetical protein DB346_04135 [Verrucomicrobia bacterium LW23]PTY04323.1 hypothetical protein DB346_02520 [Verrucomicrobia bacterium LW23]
MSHATYDVVIAGGGPAGSTAATFLAKAGKRVLLLERERFPRFHIGESLLPYNNDVLRELGVWNKLENGGFMPKPGAEFYLGNATKVHRFWFSKNLPGPYGSTFQVERARFDELLLDHAAECGAEVHEEARVTHVETDADGVRIAWEQDGATHSAAARWMIDATGRDALVGKTLGIPRHDNGFPKRVAVYSHFTGVRRNEGEAAGMITIVRIEDGWFWIIPLDEEKTSVGLVQSLAGFKAKNRTPQEEFEATVQACTELRFRFKNATRATDFHVTGDYCYRHRTLAGPRYLLAGDAGGFIDPIFSSGVMLAMRSARLAAKTILAQEVAARVGASLSAAAPLSAPLTGWQQKQYSKAVYHMMDTYANMIRMYYDNTAFEVFMNPAPWLQLPRAILAIVAGKTDLEWPLWWRMKVFYAICQLQKYMPISPRINYKDVMPSTGRNARKVVKRDLDSPPAATTTAGPAA